MYNVMYTLSEHACTNSHKMIVEYDGCHSLLKHSILAPIHVQVCGGTTSSSLDRSFSACNMGFDSLEVVVLIWKMQLVPPRTWPVCKRREYMECYIYKCMNGIHLILQSWSVFPVYMIV